ncbi:MAG TPA: ATP-binding protein [Thermodesulfobacterium commune]|nr:MAG: Capsule polysaccharide export ATP-binding protein CtrD [Desulfonauticus sp. 38_4375]HCP10154.1 ATP-binding protein [Thermodesulfobacterium commune]
MADLNSSNNNKFIKLEGVSKKFKIKGGDFFALKNINLHVNYGDRVGILGRNGAGKTTLIKIIGGVTQPSSGNVVRQMKVSWPLAFQGGFQGSLTGLDNLKFICRIYGVPWKEKIDFVQDFAELGKFFYEPVKTYSAGMRARLAFALSIVIEFDCYLIDEVMVVGDERFRKKCEKELFEKRIDRTFIIASHQPSNLKYCNRFFVLNNGELIEFENFNKAWEFYKTL